MQGTKQFLRKTTQLVVVEIDQVVYKLAIAGAMQMTIIFNIMALFGFTVLIFLGCDNVKMAGATLPYFNR